MTRFSTALHAAHASVAAPRTRPASARRVLVGGTGIALAAALGLTGCSSASGSEGGDQLRVVATTTQLTDFAQEIGGDAVDVTGLLPAGGSAHHFDPSPADLLALGEADVLIVNGAGLETFVDSAVEASEFDGTVIDASDGIDLAEAEEITSEGEAGEDDHDHDHEGDDHDHEADDEHDHAEEAHDHEADEDHEHEGDDHEGDEHDHDHGPVNPHLWTSPRYAADMATEVTRGLVEADPDRADDIQQRGDAYVESLHALDEWVSSQMERVPEADRVLVSGHDSLRYYLHDYGIEFAGSILPSFEDNAEPSAAEIDDLVHRIQERGAKAVFVESSMSPKLAETIADEAGVEVVDGDQLYADSLGGADSGAETYIEATVHNTEVILEAWGVTPEPAPEELSDEG